MKTKILNPNYFDTLQFESNTSFHAIRNAIKVRTFVSRSLSLKPLRRKNVYFKHIYAVNHNIVVMTLPFEPSIDIHDTVRYKNVMKEYGLGSYGAIFPLLKGEDFFIGTKAVLLHHVLIPPRVADINASLEWQCHHHRLKVNDIYMFRNKDFLNFSVILV